MVKRKVLFFLFGSVGGAERMTINIGKMLPTNIYQVKFVVCWRKDDICQFIPKEYEIIRIPWHNKYCFVRTRLAYVLLREKPDIVFSSTMLLNIMLLQVSSFFKIKCIVRNDNMLKLASHSRIKQMKKWYSKAKYVIAQQEEMGKELTSIIELREEKVKVLHNPIDTSLIQSKLDGVSNPYENGCINYLWVGRVHPTKGVDVLIKAFNIVRKKCDNVQLYLVGAYNESDPYYKSLKMLVKELDINNKIHFVGFDTNPYRWIKYCSCFVLPSRIEGLPNTLIDAQYLCCPCVVSDCIPMMRRIIKDGYNGYVVPVESFDILAESMLKAIELKDVKMTYIPSKKKDYVELFEL